MSRHFVDRVKLWELECDSFSFSHQHHQPRRTSYVSVSVHCTSIERIRLNLNSHQCGTHEMASAQGILNQLRQTTILCVSAYSLTPSTLSLALSLSLSLYVDACFVSCDKVRSPKMSVCRIYIRNEFSNNFKPIPLEWNLMSLLLLPLLCMPLHFDILNSEPFVKSGFENFAKMV